MLKARKRPLSGENTYAVLVTPDGKMHQASSCTVVLLAGNENEFRNGLKRVGDRLDTFLASWYGVSLGPLLRAGIRESGPIQYMDDKDIHTEHCCQMHGCKYDDDEDCPVWTAEKHQSFMCEWCVRELEGGGLDLAYLINDIYEAGKSAGYKVGIEDAEAAECIDCEDLCPGCGEPHTPHCP